MLLLVAPLESHRQRRPSPSSLEEDGGDIWVVMASVFFFSFAEVPPAEDAVGCSSYQLPSSSRHLSE